MAKDSLKLPKLPGSKQFAGPEEDTHFTRACDPGKHRHFHSEQRHRPGVADASGRRDPLGDIKGLDNRGTAEGVGDCAHRKGVSLEEESRIAKLITFIVLIQNSP